MAKVDKLLETMLRRSAQYALLADDKPLVLSINGQEAQGAVIASGQLESVLAEISPSNLPARPGGEPTTFIYDSPHGRFRVTCEGRGENRQVRIEPSRLPSYAAPPAQVVAGTTSPPIEPAAPSQHSRPMSQGIRSTPPAPDSQTKLLETIGAIIVAVALFAFMMAVPDMAALSGGLLLILLITVGVRMLGRSRSRQRDNTAAFRVHTPVRVRTPATTTSSATSPSAQANIQGNLTLLTTLNERDKQVLSVAISPDGNWLATGLVDAQINLWNLQSGSVERTLNHGGLAGAALKNLKASGQRSDLTENGVKSLAFSPDGKTLATLSSRKLNLWKMPNGDINRALVPFSNLSRNYSLVFAPDGLTLANGNMDGVVHLWDMRTLKRKFSKGHDWMIGDTPIFTSLFFGWLTQIAQRFTGQTPIAFSSDGRRIASAFYREVRVWDTQTGKLERSMEDGGQHPMAWALPYLRMRSSSSSLQGATARILCIAFSPDGQTIATGSWSKDGANLLLWDIRNGRKRALDGHVDTVNAVAFSPDGQFLVSGGKEGEVKVWNVSSGELVRTLKAHHGSVNAVALSADGRTLATASDDKSIKLWLLQ